MEAVENLVVGEETNFQIVVDEALVNGSVHGHKGDIVCHRGRFGFAVSPLTVEYIAQTHCLFFAVGKNIEFVSLQQIVFQ